MTEPFRVITQTESWKTEVRADVVGCIRALLERAEAGEITGIAYSASCSDNTVLTGCSKSESVNAIIGGLARIQHRMCGES